MANAINVSLNVNDTANLVSGAVVHNSFSGTIAGSYKLDTPEGRRCVVMVFEKYYMRTSSYASLSVTIDDFTGRTRVTSVASGGSQSLINFDWGVSQSFERVVESALAPYRVY